MSAAIRLDGTLGLRTAASKLGGREHSFFARASSTREGQCCRRRGLAVRCKTGAVVLKTDEAAAAARGGEKTATAFSVVMKFGGSSLASAERIREVANLIRKFPEETPVVVLSAMGETTNNLLLAGAKAVSCGVVKACEIPQLSVIKDLHLRTIDELGLDRSVVSGLLDELEQLLKGIAMMKELTLRTRDYLLSLGECMSTRIFAAYMNKLGKKARQYDAFDIGTITTDDFTNTDILEVTYPTVAKRLLGDWMDDPAIPIVTGFLGKGCKSCAVTTLGRGGSDLTAKTNGKDLGLREIQDVDGVLSCDPNIYANATPVPYLTFDEAAELAYFGAQVLHPQSMRAAREGSIPVRVKNSYNRHAPGTVITKSRYISKSISTSIVLKSNGTVPDIVSTRMLGQYGFPAKDVDGVLTCHPNIYANAMPVPYLTFDEAAEPREQGDCQAPGTTVTYPAFHALGLMNSACIAARPGVASMRNRSFVCQAQRSGSISEQLTSDDAVLKIIKYQDLTILHELGSGSFGTVHLANLRGAGYVAVKFLKNCYAGRSPTQEEREEFLREARVLSKLRHPNILEFVGVVEDAPGGMLAFVTEYMVDGSLWKVSQREDKYPLDYVKKLKIALDEAYAMEYMHSKGIVHFDLKGGNLLLDLKDQNFPICKVGDFGLSKIKKNAFISGDMRGTLRWMAPELLDGNIKVSEKVDVYSYGICLWELETGEVPYGRMTHDAIKSGVKNNQLRPIVPAHCDPEWAELMVSCWEHDPVRRPNSTEVVVQLQRMLAMAMYAKAD